MRCTRTDMTTTTTNAINTMVTTCECTLAHVVAVAVIEGGAVVGVVAVVAVVRGIIIIRNCL